MKFALIAFISIFSTHLVLGQSTASPYRKENPKIAFEIKSFIQNPLNCNSTKTNFQVKTDVFYYDNTIRAMLPYIKDNFDDNCLKVFLRSYIETKGGIAENKNLDRNELKLKSIFESNVQNLTSVLFKLDPSFQASFHPDKVTSGQITVEEYLKESEDFGACRELQTGESKVVQGNIINIAGGTHYLLERTKPSRFRATLAIDFNDSNPNLVMTKEQMLLKVKECLDVSQTYFRSTDGGRLEVSILTPEEVSKLPKEKRPKIKKISMWPAGVYTPASDTFPVDINCSEIVHETLHHLGLADEYREREQVAVYAHSGKPIPEGASIQALLGNGTAIVQSRFMCRSHSETNSIMNNNRAVFDDIISRQVTCECSTEDCLKVVSHPSDKVRDLALGSLWQDLYHSNEDRICKSKVVNTFKSLDLDDLENLVTHQVVSESQNEIQFTHSLVTRQKDGKYTAQEHNYECACNNKNECLVLDKLRLRLQNRMAQYPDKCPIEGSKEISTKYLPHYTQISHGVSVEGNRYIMSSYSMIQDRTILLPAQFERIIKGTCTKNATKYTTCAKSAYLENTGLTCPSKPSYCEDHTQWLQQID